MSNHRQAQAPSTLHLCSCVSRNRRRGGAHHNCCKEKVERFLLLWKDALFSWTWSRIPQGACYQAGLKIPPARKEVLVLGDAWQIPPPSPLGEKNKKILFAMPKPLYKNKQQKSTFSGMLFTQQVGRVLQSISSLLGKPTRCRIQATSTARGE